MIVYKFVSDFEPHPCVDELLLKDGLFPIQLQNIDGILFKLWGDHCRCKAGESHLQTEALL